MSLQRMYTVQPKVEAVQKLSATQRAMELSVDYLRHKRRDILEDAIASKSKRTQRRAVMRVGQLDRLIDVQQRQIDKLEAIIHSACAMRVYSDSAVASMRVLCERAIEDADQASIGNEELRDTIDAHEEVLLSIAGGEIDSTWETEYTKLVKEEREQPGLYLGVSSDQEATIPSIELPPTAPNRTPVVVDGIRGHRANGVCSGVGHSDGGGVHLDSPASDRRECISPRRHSVKEIAL